jgi:plasmid stability protein
MTTRARGYRTSDDVHRALRIRAAETGETMEGILDRALRKELGMMTKTIEVAVIEAGGGYTERLESLRLDLSGTEQEMIDQAIAAVAERGYRVMPVAEGGCCAYVGVSDGEDYVAITVYPSSE